MSGYNYGPLEQETTGGTFAEGDEEMINRRVVKRMVERIETLPESYDQGAFYAERSEKSPCRTVACLAGEAIICNAATYDAGLKQLHKLVVYGGVSFTATTILKLPWNHGVFGQDASCWSAPFNEQFAKARTKKAQAKVAVAYLRECLERGTMIWKGDADV